MMNPSSTGEPRHEKWTAKARGQAAMAPPKANPDHLVEDLSENMQRLSLTKSEPRARSTQQFEEEARKKLQTLLMQPEFCRPPKKGKDMWDLSHADSGWLCRIHKTERIRPFHPLHLSTPPSIDPAKLCGSRISVRFSGSSEKPDCIEDCWLDPQNATFPKDKEHSWVGFTFFLVGSEGEEAAEEVEETSRVEFEVVSP